MICRWRSTPETAAWPLLYFRRCCKEAHSPINARTLVTPVIPLHSAADELM